MAEIGSLTVYPGAYDQSDYAYQAINGATKPVGKGSNNTSYATIYLKAGGSAITSIYWPFDLSAIPEDATIDSVSCNVLAYFSELGIPSSCVATRSMRLYSGGTAKGSGSTIPVGNGTGVVSLTAGTWTRDELKQCRLRLYAKRGTSSTSTTYTLRFYGADLTVQYTDNNEKFMLKLGGAWHDVARTFKKVSGIWVEQTDLANVIEDGVRYQNGGEIISPKKTVTITGSGDATYSYVKINGVTYTSPATVEVSVGDVIEATVGGDSLNFLDPEICCVKVDGRVYVDKGGTHKHTVTSDCTVDLYLYNGYVSYGTITITTT